MRKNLNLEQNDVKHLGGKGFNLRLLSEAGYNVPPWFIVSVSVFRTFLEIKLNN